MRTDSNIILLIYLIAVIDIVFFPFLEAYTFIDELLCAILFVLSVLRFGILQKKEFKCFAFIVLAYLGYSMVMEVNIMVAAARDFLQFMKPFFSFYAVYYAKVYISPNREAMLRKLGLILGIVCISMLPYIEQIYSNTAGYYASCTFAALLFLLFSEGTKRNYYIFLLLLSVGTASLRSKFLAELMCYAFILLFVGRKIKLSWKVYVYLVALATAAIWVNYDKFYSYFIIGYKQGLVRTWFFYASVKMLWDYFPFGAGFGTFGTDTSGLYYSPLYYKYGLSNLWGCGPKDYGTISSFFGDTFYPVLFAQFGVVGTYLFFLFWKKRWNESLKISKHQFKIVLIIIAYMAVESIANTAFLGPVSVPSMMTLGLCLNKYYSYGKSQRNSTCLQRR